MGRVHMDAAPAVAGQQRDACGVPSPCSAPGIYGVPKQVFFYVSLFLRKMVVY